VEHLSGTTLLGWLLALSTNIKLGWKRLARTNTLVYSKYSSIKDVKRFITMSPGPNVIKLFTSVIYEFSYHAGMFGRPGLKSLPGTNAIAYYESL
jgi:hypothetical protein